MYPFSRFSSYKLGDFKADNSDIISFFLMCVYVCVKPTSDFKSTLLRMQPRKKR